MIQQINNDNLQTTLQNNEVVLVDFYADWCGPCQALAPTLEKLAKEFDGKATIAKVNVDKNRELSAQYNVRSIPALFYFKNGKLIGKQGGNQPYTVLSQNIEQLLSAEIES